MPSIVLRRSAIKAGIIVLVWKSCAGVFETQSSEFRTRVTRAPIHIRFICYLENLHCYTVVGLGSDGKTICQKQVWVSSYLLPICCDVNLCHEQGISYSPLPWSCVPFLPYKIIDKTKITNLCISPRWSTLQSGSPAANNWFEPISSRKDLVYDRTNLHSGTLNPCGSCPTDTQCL